MTPEEMQNALDAKFKSLQADLQEAQKIGATKDELLKISDAIKAQGTALEDFIESQKTKIVEGFMGQFKNFLVENKDKLDQIKASKSGTIEFVPKAVGPLATTSGGDGVVVPPPNHNTSLGGFNFRNDNPLLSLFTTTSTDQSSLAYTELEPKDGNYGFVAEGGNKPQIDFKWSNQYITPVKIAAHEVLSEEVVTDIKRMMSVAKEYLKKKHDLFKVDALFFSTKSSTAPKGATKYGRQFVAGDMALKVANPNFMDVVNAGITDIYITHNYTDESSYEANLVLVSPVDFFLNLVSAKDGNGLPLYPQAGLFNTVTIGGVTIKPWAKIPAGKIFIADMSKYNVVNYVPFSIRLGWINAQFITNQFTLVGESRFYAYVKRLDEQAFIYDDIATIKTAITLPAPVVE